MSEILFFMRGGGGMDMVSLWGSEGRQSPGILAIWKKTDFYTNAFVPSLLKQGMPIPAKGGFY